MGIFSLFIPVKELITFVDYSDFKLFF